LLELSRKAALRRGEAVGTQLLGIVAAWRGDHDEARALYEESLALTRGVDAGWFLSVATNNLGDLHMREGDYERAAGLFEESLAIGEARGDLDRRARQLTNPGFAVRELGDLTRAHELLRRGLAAAQEIGLVEIEIHALLGIATYEAEAGDTVAAARLLGRKRALESRLSAASDKYETELEERTLARLRAALGPERLASELVTGAALSHEEAIDLALGRSGSATVE
jgi:tetratricopeptide (TPR) repeat protein